MLNRSRLCFVLLRCFRRSSRLELKTRFLVGFAKALADRMLCENLKKNKLFAGSVQVVRSKRLS